MSRGLVVSDAVEAARRLSVVGYYRLSGYWYPYRAPGVGAVGRSDAFLPGTTFEEVIGLSTFDRQLKFLVLDALERVEIAVRFRVGYTLGLRGAYAHLDPEALDRSFGRTEAYKTWRAKVDAAQASSREDFVQHYVRNTCAHHSRLWNRNLTVQLAPRHFTTIASLTGLTAGGPSGSRPAGVVSILAYLMNEVAPGSSWAADVTALVHAGLAGCRRRPDEMGFPARWLSLTSTGAFASTHRDGGPGSRIATGRTPRSEPLAGRCGWGRLGASRP